ncbi:uncharacterized protein J7T54_006983 [Emericellopsis cladophorae]|uniref:Nephrocystin 3-like N-terminal domain-containing protein n=1 Tax=Emericellopsis cladophorae TaxID=2686198 RepID=A0A9P9Y8E8_9HYPO|nr:uncharacterized protein J7T54_006983 [Emericellopsis cladophorae]KAI6785341.1 hypothetical protein J7T54_006983 [Emericellopsis cladophorae]
MTSPNDYSVGWICAIKVEYLAARLFLDEEYAPLKTQNPNDDNVYTLGRMGEHKIAIACLPKGSYGTVSAANVAKDMLRTFTNMRFGLMVGIGGGVPTSSHDIRLGDVVVSTPDGADGAVLQYDFGKTIQGKQFKMTGHLNQPPQILLSAVQNLGIEHQINGHTIDETITSILAANPRAKKQCQKPDPESDLLYHSDVVHTDGKAPESCMTGCGNASDVIITRPDRLDYEKGTQIHYGLIASSNSLMKDAKVCFRIATQVEDADPETKIRDALAGERNVLCFEMEAAGLMPSFKCLAIRGICDYSDSHKNKIWQGYAAMTAAAYAKGLLGRISPQRVDAENRVLLDLLSSTIIQSLLEEKGILLYFFFDFSDKAKQFFEDMLHSLLYQLYCISPSTHKPLDELLDSIEPSQPSVAQMISTFSAIAGAVERLRVVIDALDECITKNMLLAWLQDVCGRNTHLQLITTSRPTHDIESSIRSWAPPRADVFLGAGLIDPGICEVIHDKVSFGHLPARNAGRVLRLPGA